MDLQGKRVSRQENAVNCVGTYDWAVEARGSAQTADSLSVRTADLLSARAADLFFRPSAHTTDWLPADLQIC